MNLDDAELFQRLQDAGAEWIDKRTCRIMLDQELAQWLLDEAGRPAMSEAELQPYVEQFPNFGHEPIRIYSGLHSIEDGEHRLQVVAATGRPYSTMLRVVGP